MRPRSLPAFCREAEEWGGYVPDERDWRLRRVGVRSGTVFSSATTGVSQ
jgi:hypothetical protein